MKIEQLKNIIEAALLASAVPLKAEKLQELFTEDEEVSSDDILKALNILGENCAERSIELKEVRSGFRLQVKQNYTEWVSKLWQERPSKYSRALLETLALVAYRQPITRSEVEQVRGVSVSSHIMKTLLERNWVKVVGHRDVPGKPGLYATTKEFLDYFNLKNLSELPPLSEIRDIDSINAELEFEMPAADPITEPDDNHIKLSIDIDDSEEISESDEANDSDSSVEVLEA
ncbi:Segregation and condensation protein B [hydrothermal vent metagenome]|uniref:Segregation and condensation protein B n=1 Tax=hydrothermal vent metagenome TaxID=652676 RepID=A0A3B1A664_9ZZZZ